MAAPMIHPRFVAANRVFFPSLATIEAATTTQDSYGQPVETWAAVPTLTGIGAAKAPLSAQERQAAQFTATDQAWSVLLHGAYPEITTRHRAVIDGAVHDIDAVETDQTGSLTRIRVRTVEV